MENETKPRLETVPMDAHPSDARAPAPTPVVDAAPPKNKRRPFVVVGIIVLNVVARATVAAVTVLPFVIAYGVFISGLAYACLHGYSALVGVSGGALFFGAMAHAFVTGYRSESRTGSAH